MKANIYMNSAKRLATMLVAIMIVGVGSAWGATTGTINFGSASGSLNINGASVNGNDNQSNQWTVATEGTSSFTPNASYAQVGSSNSPASSITLTMTLPAKKKITAFSAKFGGFSGTAGSVALKVDNVSIGSGSLNASNDVTVSNSSQAVGKELKVTVTGISKGVKCYYVSYTYETPVPHTVNFAPHFGTFDDPSVLGEGNTIAESSGAEGVSLPTVTPYADGWGFYGWASTACGEETADVPTIVGKAGETYYPANDETLHAVYAKGEFTKETSTITAGDKYLIVANSDGHNYVMTNTYSTYTSGEDEYGQLAGVQFDETNSTTHSYSAASIKYDYIFTFVTSSSVSVETGDWMIKNLADNKYLSVDYKIMYLPLADMTQGKDGNYIRESSGSWLITNHYSDEANKLFFNSTEKKFLADKTTASSLLIYKETTPCRYFSNPCGNALSLTAVNAATATLALSANSIVTCSGTAADRQVTITATPATGYTFTESARLTYAGDGTATYVSGPTANGDAFDFVYQFSQEDNGDGEFSVTSATPKTYTITLEGNGGTGNTANVTATFNSATLSSAITNPEKTHFVFNGWFSGEGGTGSLIINKNGALQANVTGYTGANGIWTRDEATTLYAQWTAHTYTNYRTRCCNLDVVTGVHVSATTKNSVKLSWTEPADKTGITGYQVVKASDGSVVVDEIDANATSATVTGLTECEAYNYRVASVSGSCKNTSDVVEAIPFEGAKTVTFDYNGGSGSLASFTTECGSKTVTLPTPDDREGYTFSGWYSGSSLIGVAGDSYTPTADITLKAVYVAIPRHNITLNAFGGAYEVIANKLEGTSVWSLISTKTGPEMTGYAFLGWSTTENSESAILNSGSGNTLTDNLTLYAIYKKATYVYRIVTSGAPTDGQYLIVYETGSVAFNGGLTTLDATSNTIGVEIKEDGVGKKIAVSTATEAAEFTISGKTGGFNILSASGFYIGRNSTSNGLDIAASAETFTNAISVTDGIATITCGSTNYLRYNKNSGQTRFRYFNTNSQETICLYKKVAILEGEATSVPTLTVADGATINANSIYPDGKAGNIVVENGGKLNVSSSLTVNDLTIESMAGKSGQLTGSGSVTVNGNIYMDVKFYTSANDATEATLNATEANQWYMISAPFDVNLADGFINPVSGVTMHRGNDDNVNTFDLFEYDGEKRANTGTTGWTRVGGQMPAGRACLIGFNPGQPTTIRLKAASNTISDPTSISLSEFTEAVDAEGANSNWNGVANPRFQYTSVDKDVMVWNNEEGENGRKYITYGADEFSFVVGTPFFVQATGEIDLTGSLNGSLRAPKREDKRYSYRVQITREGATEFADQMYVRASEEATNTYEQGHDMITWNGTSGKSALLWAENYGGKRLSIEEAPLANNGAIYTLGIFAPNAGEYVISTLTEDEDATLYLTLNGHIIWNLSQGAYTAELRQGQNSGYGLKIVAAPKVSTDVEQSVVSDQPSVQKVIIDEHVYILRGGQMYDVNGKMVK